MTLVLVVKTINLFTLANQLDTVPLGSLTLLLGHLLVIVGLIDTTGIYLHQVVSYLEKTQLVLVVAIIVRTASSVGYFSTNLRLG